LLVKDKKLIDVLVEQGKIKREMTSAWKNLSNLELENRLRAEHLISNDDISQAYASLYGLPYVSLKDRQIPQEVLQIVPEKLAREYKIIAYEKTDTSRVALADPSKLTANFQDVIKGLEKEKGFKIELAITSLDDFTKTIAQYQKTSVKEVGIPILNPKTQSKKMDLDKVEIPYEVINKFPQDIARKYQMVVFEAPHSSFIKVAAVDPNDKKIREILDFVKTKNDIAIEEYQVTPGEIERAMRFYEPPQMKIEPPPPPPPSKIAPPAETPPPKISPQPMEKPMEKIPPPPIPQVVFQPAEQEEKQKLEMEKEVPKTQAELAKKVEGEIPEIRGKLTEPLVLPQESDLDKYLGKTIKDVKELEEIAQTGHVPKTVAAIIILAVTRKASDIHIEPAEKNIRIRFRIDGLLRDIIKLPIEIHPAIVSRVKILAKLKIDESRIPQDGRFDVTAIGHAIDLRISTLPTVHGEKIAMRILDKSAHLYTLEELGVTDRSLKVLQDNMNKPYGVILSTGPTGSGKTTTLYAILNRISNASVNIITLEDPVEYEMGGINQCQIKPKIGFTFANGLRSVLRQDPNIIMVGEIRDSDTASLATHAALTGHLVLSTLHTNNAAGALPRLIDMGVEPFFITSLINAIIAQRLVRKLCPKCKRPAHIPEPIQKQIEGEIISFNLPKPYNFFEGAGCRECELGYKGRIGIFEVLTMSGKLESLVLARKPASELEAEAVRGGMVTMKQDGLIKALKGETTVSEVLRVVTV